MTINTATLKQHAPILWLQWAIAALLPLVFMLFLFDEYGWRHAALALAAIALGVVFQRSQFGFASTWRALILRGDGTGIRAQMLWIALAALPFALLTIAPDGESAQAIANIRPLTASVAIGAFIFGVGMQLGGACTSGSIVGAGGGGANGIVAIIGFVIGALIAAEQIEFWNELPVYESFSFYHEWGISGAVIIIALCAAVAAATLLLPQRVTYSPLYWAAALLALLSVLVLILAGQPWGILNGFTIAGGKLLLANDYEDVLFWEFWVRFANSEEVLTAGWFAGNQMVTNAGMVMGVVLAALSAGKLSAPWRNVSAKRLLLAVAGGVVMGYGAQISYGCNIGSYISALSSGSAHGWLWLFTAFIGTVAGVGVRRLVGLDK